MGLTQAQKDGLDVALNEASFLDVDVSSVEEGVVVVTVRALSWDDGADEPTYPVVHLRLSGVSRLAASLREGVWSDQDAPVQHMNVGGVGEQIRAMGASDLYGWEYIDANPANWAHWSKRLSVDHQNPLIVSSHHMHLFKEQFQPSRTLDLRIWFEDLSVATEFGTHLDVEEFVRRAKRWWDALHAGDKRANATGIFPGNATP